MAYVARTDRPSDKAARYLEVEAEILAVLDGEPNVTARMATVASMLADAFEQQNTELAFKILDLTADSALGDRQLFSCPGKRAVASCRFKGTQGIKRRKATRHCECSYGATEGGASY